MRYLQASELFASSNLLERIWPTNGGRRSRDLWCPLQTNPGRPDLEVLHM